MNKQSLIMWRDLCGNKLNTKFHQKDYAIDKELMIQGFKSNIDLLEIFYI